MEVNAHEDLEAQELRVDYEASLQLEIDKEKGFTKKQLKAMAEEHRTFAKVYADEETPLTYKNIAKSIAAFERTLITPAKWDDYLTGSAGALTFEQKRGLNSFLNVGCISCHMGTLLGSLAASAA